jgi:hypothetical protein
MNGWCRSVGRRKRIGQLKVPVRCLVAQGHAQARTPAAPFRLQLGKCQRRQQSAGSGEHVVAFPAEPDLGGSPADSRECRLASATAWRPTMRRARSPHAVNASTGQCNRLATSSCSNVWVLRRAKRSRAPHSTLTWGPQRRANLLTRRRFADPCLAGDQRDATAVRTVSQEAAEELQRFGAFPPLRPSMVGVIRTGPVVLSASDCSNRCS